MQNILESVAITVLCIVLLGCIGHMLDIAYNVIEHGAVEAWAWIKRQARIAGLRSDIHGYDVDMAYLMKAAPFDARGYCLITALRHAAEAELDQLLAEKQQQPKQEKA